MEEVQVVAGEHDLYADDETEQFAGVTSAVMHQENDNLKINFRDLFEFGKRLEIRMSKSQNQSI